MSELQRLYSSVKPYTVPQSLFQNGSETEEGWEDLSLVPKLKASLLWLHGKLQPARWRSVFIGKGQLLKLGKEYQSAQERHGRKRLSQFAVVIPFLFLLPPCVRRVSWEFQDPSSQFNWRATDWGRWDEKMEQLMHLAVAESRSCLLISILLL